MRTLPLIPLLIWLTCCRPAPTEQVADTLADSTAWMLGPFVKVHEANPVLRPDSTLRFFDPLRGDSVRWAAKDVFNPAAVVRSGKVLLLFRAEDSVGRYQGTSRVGLAVSEDGLAFTARPTPVFYPQPDSLKRYEWEGGCEDPRVVEDSSGRYVLTYTAYDGQTARLCVATSTDLRQWRKHGLAFPDSTHRDLWSKSGSIVCRREGNRLVAARVNGKYWMYWGDTDARLATSNDLIRWTPLTSDSGFVAALRPRPGHFDSRLVEPGPPALLTDRGIVLLYNGMNLAPTAGGDTSLAEGTYAAGQALFAADDPTHLLERPAEHFLHPEAPYEVEGQVNRVCFIEGLVPFGDVWLLYYGTADSKIAVAQAQIEK